MNKLTNSNLSNSYAPHQRPPLHKGALGAARLMVCELLRGAVFGLKWASAPTGKVPGGQVRMGIAGKHYKNRISLLFFSVAAVIISQEST